MQITRLDYFPRFSNTEKVGLMAIFKIGYVSFGFSGVLI